MWTIPLFAWGVDLTPARATEGAWVALALILLFPTVLGYLLNGYGLARLPASTTASYVFAQPLITVAVGVAVLGEPLASTTILAALAIAAGIWLVARRGATPPRAPRLPESAWPAAGCGR